MQITTDQPSVKSDSYRQEDVKVSNPSTRILSKNEPHVQVLFATLHHFVAKKYGDKVTTFSSHSGTKRVAPGEG